MDALLCLLTEFKASRVYFASVNAVAGGCAGACTDAVLFPLDTLKTRLQASSKTLATSAKRPTSLYAGLGAGTTLVWF